MSSYRGARGPRGSWRQHGRSDFYQHGRSLTTSSASAPPPLGDLVEEITRESLLNHTSEAYCGITDEKLIASYNWIAHLTPKIMIPGKPALWTPLRGPQQFAQDDGIYYRDRNAAAYNEHPMEAAVMSVMKEHAENDPRQVDIVACNSTIGNLLRFIRGDDRPFRMLVEVIGDTVHLIRRENTPKEPLVNVKGYHHTFMKECAIWEPEVRRSTSHHRIVRYQFDGLDMIVRFEADGYVKQKDATQPKIKTSEDKEAEHDLLDGLNALNISTASGASTTEGLEIIEGGEEISQDAVFDLKTRSIRVKDRDVLGEEMHRLWIARFRKFVLAYHTYGSFEDVEVKDIWDEVQVWEKNNQPDLRRLAKLLRHIVAGRRAADDVKIEIVRQEGADTLEVRERLPDAGKPFSDETREAWAQWLGADGIASDQALQKNDGDESDSDGGDFIACDEECGYCGNCSRS